MTELQIKLERLELMLVEDGYNKSNIVLQTVLDMQKLAINYTRCCTEFADGKCRPMVNADWTYLRCECGKRFEPKG